MGTIVFLGGGAVSYERGTPVGPVSRLIMKKKKKKGLEHSLVCSTRSLHTLHILCKRFLISLKTTGCRTRYI